MTYLIIILLIIGLLVFIFNYLELIKENFESSKKIILLGDSILNNKNYVYEKESVEYILKNKYSYEIYNFALDGEVLKGMKQNINKISKTNLSDVLVISIGGNDILHGANINKLFDDYKKVIKDLHLKFPKNKIYVLDVYYPPCCRFKKYYDKITIWNNKLNNLNNINNVKIINISTKITNKTDFVFEIEPSYEGSIKIAKTLNDLII